MTEIVGGGLLAATGIKYLNDIAGPAAKAVGAVFAEWAEYRLRNWLGIAQAAETAVGPDPEPGLVHPQVLHRVLDDATWLDDPLMQHYAGGLLAASRTSDGTEQRGAYYMNILSFMTPMQVHLHYQIYSAVRNQADRSTDLGKGTRNAVVMFDLELLARDVVLAESADLDISEATVWLGREGLIKPILVGPTDSARGSGLFPEALPDEPVAIFEPTIAGILLFLWAHGVRTGDQNAIFRQDMLRLPEPTVEPIGVKRYFIG